MHLSRLLYFLSSFIFSFYRWANFANGEEQTVEKLVLKWAPLVYLAPGEKYFPSSIFYFLDKVTPMSNRRMQVKAVENLPLGADSEYWSLVTKDNIDSLLANFSSFVHGKNPEEASVPVYASVVLCRTPRKTNNTTATNSPHFYVTYWMFYPFNKGKSMCTLDMGRLGAWPIPKVNNLCWGDVRDFGSHVGDWEHFSLYFKDSSVPLKMYVSAHDAGAVYKYSTNKGRFVFESRHVRKGILQRPNFPDHVKLSTAQHPVLFAAEGSHGLWTAPGRHKFVRMPRLYDDTGFGVAWQTWQNIIFLKDDSWLKFRGRWGNPRTRCHPVSNLGVHLCELVDGPTGIPAKKSYFQCS